MPRPSLTHQLHSPGELELLTSDHFDKQEIVEFSAEKKEGDVDLRGRVERRGRGERESGEGGWRWRGRGRVEREGEEWIGRVEKKGLHACFYIAIRETSISFIF